MKIAVLLSTYNGSKYLEELLLSIVDQNVNCKIYIRDDCSSDSTSQLLIKFFEDKPNLLGYLDISKTNLGVTQSFSSLIEKALDSDYLFFCDQDDVWIPGRINFLINKISSIEHVNSKLIPIAVFSDAMVVDSSLNVISRSFWEYENNFPSINFFLHRLLIQNSAPGCTMVINSSLAKMMSKIPKGAIRHDWWGLLIATCFGIASWIDSPLILYRQHSHNDLGANKINLLEFIINYKNFISKSKKNLRLTKIQSQVFLNSFPNVDYQFFRVISTYIDLHDYSFLKRKIFYLFSKYKKSSIIRNILTLIII